MNLRLYSLFARSTLVGDIPKNSDHPRFQGKYKTLCLWAHKQRKELKGNDEEDDENCLSGFLLERKQKLGELGFVFDVKWEAKFELLKEYMEEFGECTYIAIRFDLVGLLFVF